MRVDGWESRLYALIEAARGREYKFGTHDCVSFACECVKAIDGRDIKVGDYVTAKDAKKILRGKGGFTAAVTRFLGVEPGPVSLAQRGDIVELQRGKHSHLGVCVGAQVAMPKLDGLAFVPLSECKQAWRV
jgi:hypothetical protein